METRKMFNFALKISLFYFIVIGITEFLNKIIPALIFKPNRILASFTHWSMLSIVGKIVIIVFLLFFIKNTENKLVPDESLKKLLTVSTGLLLILISISSFFWQIPMVISTLIASAQMAEANPGLYNNYNITVIVNISINIIQLVTGIFIFLHRSKKTYGS